MLLELKKETFSFRSLIFERTYKRVKIAYSDILSEITGQVQILSKFEDFDRVISLEHRKE